MKVLAEKAADAVGVAHRRVDEAHPALVGPARHRAGADAVWGVPVEDGNARRIRREKPRPASLSLDELRDWREQVDGRGNVAPERLRGNVHAGTLPAEALPLDGLVLEELVPQGLDDERGAEFSTLHQLRRRGGGDDGVIVRARDPLVEPLNDDDASRNHLEDFAHRVPDGLHLRAAPRADAQLGRDRVEHLNALQVRGKRGPSGVTALAARLRLGRNVCLG